MSVTLKEGRKKECTFSPFTPKCCLEWKLEASVGPACFDLKDQPRRSSLLPNTLCKGSIHVTRGKPENPCWEESSFPAPLVSGRKAFLLMLPLFSTRPSIGSALSKEKDFILLADLRQGRNRACLGCSFLLSWECSSLNVSKSRPAPL